MPRWTSSVLLESLRVRRSRWPLIVLLVLPQNGVWYARTFSRVQDNESRPLVLIDTANRQLYMFATNNSGCDPSGIYYKQSPLDNVSLLERFVALTTAAIDKVGSGSPS